MYVCMYVCMHACINVCVCEVAAAQWLGFQPVVSQTLVWSYLVLFVVISLNKGLYSHALLQCIQLYYEDLESAGKANAKLVPSFMVEVLVGLWVPTPSFMWHSQSSCKMLVSLSGGFFCTDSSVCLMHRHLSVTGSAIPSWWLLQKLWSAFCIYKKSCKNDV